MAGQGRACDCHSQLSHVRVGHRRASTFWRRDLGLCPGRSHGCFVRPSPSQHIPVIISPNSDLRQVPDNQEVFIYPGSGLSIIVEILESVEPADGLDAVRSDSKQTLRCNGNAK